MHTVFHRPAGLWRPASIEDLSSALAESLGPLEPLQPAQLQEAHAAEKRLREQLRLWDAAIWSSVLQQRLESKKADGEWLLVDSLMGPPALAAARQLVLKKGLQWFELSPDQLQAANDTSSTSSDSSRGRRSRKKSNSTTAAGPEPGEQQQGADRVVLVISRRELTAEGVADGCAELLGGGSEISSAGQSRAFWLNFLTRHA